MKKLLTLIFLVVSPLFAEVNMYPNTDFFIDPDLTVTQFPVTGAPYYTKIDELPSSAADFDYVRIDCPATPDPYGQFEFTVDTSKIIPPKPFIGTIRADLSVTLRCRGVGSDAKFVAYYSPANSKPLIPDPSTQIPPYTVYTCPASGYENVVINTPFEFTHYDTKFSREEFSLILFVLCDVNIPPNTYTTDILDISAMEYKLYNIKRTSFPVN